MAQKTFANFRGIAHKGSGGMSIVFPDVCKVPTGAGPIPIPFPNIGQASDTSSSLSTSRRSETAAAILRWNQASSTTTSGCVSRMRTAMREWPL